MENLNSSFLALSLISFALPCKDFSPLICVITPGNASGGPSPGTQRSSETKKNKRGSGGVGVGVWGSGLGGRVWGRVWGRGLATSSPLNVNKYALSSIFYPALILC